MTRSTDRLGGKKIFPPDLPLLLLIPGLCTMARFRNRNSLLLSQSRSKPYSFSVIPLPRAGVLIGSVHRSDESVTRRFADVNYGINGMGTVGEYLLFQQECEPLLQAQDVVLVMFYLNDFLDNIQPNGARVCGLESWRDRNDPPETSPCWQTEKILSYSYLYNILSYQLNTLKKQLGEQRGQIIFAQQVDLHDQHPAFQVTKHFLHEFKTACQNKQADFVLVYIPGQYELDEGEGNGDQKRQIEHSFHSAIQAITDSLDIEMLDLLPYFLEVKHEQPEVRLTLYGDAHWNALGHQYAARAIAAYLDNLRDHDIVTE